ncbi:hypothetical protein H8E88_10380 [candidate division KSB1 bacterium]|nr:hypothetical protein [candidate division KSB1 bacterium]
MANYLRMFVLVVIMFIFFGGSRLYAETSEKQSSFYVTQHGDDENPGTKALPWRTLKPVNQHTFNPGDTVLFSRGSSFNGALHISGSGVTGRPIIYTEYGTGRAPRFTNQSYQLQKGRMIQIDGCYIVVDGLYFYDGIPANRNRHLTAREAGAIFVSLKAEHNIIKNCEIENCPMGIQVIGQHNLITHNYIHDCNIFLSYPSWGPVGIMVANSNNEISYNKIVNYFSKGGRFGADGGAIEIDDQKHARDNIYIHHNYSTGNEGFLEITTGASADNIQVSYNVSDDYQEFIFFWAGTNCIVENNTVLCLKPPNSRVRVVFSFEKENEVTVRNNIFVLAKGLQVFAGDSVYNADKWNQPHSNNVYFVVDGTQENPCGISLGRGDIIADPLFMDLENRDLHLRAGSPAIDAGVDVGRKLDFEDNLVPQGGKPDIGAFEFIKY